MAAIRSSVHRPWSMVLVATSDLITFVGTVLGRAGASWGAWLFVFRLRSAPFLRVISGNRRWPMHPGTDGRVLAGCTDRHARRATPPPGARTRCALTVTHKSRTSHDTVLSRTVRVPFGAGRKRGVSHGYRHAKSGLRAANRHANKRDRVREAKCRANRDRKTEQTTWQTSQRTTNPIEVSRRGRNSHLTVTAMGVQRAHHQSQTTHAPRKENSRQHTAASDELSRDP